MQLASLSPYSIADIQPKIACAHALFRYLDAPPPSEQMFLFSQRLDASSSDFPLLHAGFHKLGGGNLNQMSGAQRLELRVMLKEDVRPLVCGAVTNALADKFFHEERLPAEPVECMFRIDELIRTKRHQIERFTEDIANLKAATILVKTVLDNKRSADSFDQLLLITDCDDDHDDVDAKASHRRAKKSRRNGNF